MKQKLFSIQFKNGSISARGIDAEQVMDENSGLMVRMAHLGKFIAIVEIAE